MSGSTYKLKDAKRLLRENSYRINTDVSIDALNDFGWTEADIKSAFLKLNGAPRPVGHFYKTAPSEKIPGVMLDFYKASNLNGEDVYCHFYMKNGRLIINSFKRWQGRKYEL
ncbi:MAG TPA: type II toxin-antitoxin system MqsR family toxin [Fibrobacteria bacterium]|nr:type II toxin-antitoxin system MqsR family toxin [Fibrobacteria bacterium]